MEAVLVGQMSEPALDFLRWTGHAGFFLEHKKRIYIDPWNLPEGMPKADIVLITHEHEGHCSIKDVKKIAKYDTVIVGPHVALHKFLHNQVPMNHFEFNKKNVLGYPVEAVHACNADPAKKHPATKNWIGFIIEVDGLRLYHMGDTDVQPGLESVKNVDVALVPVAGQDVMTPEEAVRAAQAVKPKLAVPMHYGSAFGGTAEDAQRFVDLCRAQGVGARLPQPYHPAAGSGV